MNDSVLQTNDDLMLKAAHFCKDLADELHKTESSTLVPSPSTFGSYWSGDHEPTYTFEGFDIDGSDGRNFWEDVYESHTFNSGGEDAPWAAGMHGAWTQAITFRCEEIQAIYQELTAYQEILVAALKNYTAVDLENEGLLESAVLDDAESDGPGRRDPSDF